MAPAEMMLAGYIKIEDSPSPEPKTVATIELASAKEAPSAQRDPRDPEGFLKRCSGFNKKTKLPCNSSIGKKSEQSGHLTFLPTCRTHRDQRSRAGWCKHQHNDGSRCGILFKWTPPYFELCSDHQGHPNNPCYYFRLPLELRHQIFSYLLPNRPIGSSTAALHDGKADVFDRAFVSSHMPPPPPRPQPVQHPHFHHPHPRGSNLIFHTHGSHKFGSVFPMSLVDLFLVSRQFYQEAKHLLFSSVLFTIDVRKDGAFMCGRRLLEPRRADGSSHYGPEKADEAKQLFLKNFDFSAVKHYAVDILVENWKSGILYPPNTEWDEEVELYDIRDYISVVVSGVLAKSRKLCKLQVRVCLADFDWSHEQTLENTKLIVGPFESLRKVENPRILSICAGRPNNNSMLTVQRANASIPNTSRAPICSVPSIPTHTPVLAPGMPDFDAYASSWSDLISQDSASPITTKPPIRAMFTAFKDFYTELSIYAPEVTYTHGRHAFLHRARVAREQEDVEAFRVLRNDLIQHWFNYQEREERTRTHMNARLTNLLETDLYPSHEWDENKRNPHQEQEQALCAAPSSSSSSSSSSRRPSYPTQQVPISPVTLHPETMAAEGIPMTSNPRNQPHLVRWPMHIPMPPTPPPTAQQLQMQLQQQMHLQHQMQLQQQAARNGPAPAPTQAQAQAQAQAQQQGQGHLRSYNSRLFLFCGDEGEERGDEEEEGEEEEVRRVQAMARQKQVEYVKRKLQHDQQQQYQQQQGVGEEGGAGPSMKKRRVGDWMSGGGGGESNTVVVDGGEDGGDGDEEEVTYIGKGKGKRVSGVICID